MIRSYLETTPLGPASEPFFHPGVFRRRTIIVGFFGGAFGDDVFWCFFGLGVFCFSRDDFFDFFKGLLVGPGLLGL